MKARRVEWTCVCSWHGCLCICERGRWRENPVCPVHGIPLPFPESSALREARWRKGSGIVPRGQVGIEPALAARRSGAGRTRTFRATTGPQGPKSWRGVSGAPDGEEHPAEAPVRPYDDVEGAAVPSGVPRIPAGAPTTPSAATVPPGAARRPEVMTFRRQAASGIVYVTIIYPRPFARIQWGGVREGSCPCCHRDCASGRLFLPGERASGL